VTDSAGTSGQDPTTEHQVASWVPEPPATDGSAAHGSPVAERPELAVGAAFAGGLLAALILKRLAR
jgi:hypothetical protein